MGMDVWARESVWSGACTWVCEYACLCVCQERVPMHRCVLMDVCVCECLHSCMYIGVCICVCLGERERALEQVHAHRHVCVCEREAERAHAQVLAHGHVCECQRECGQVHAHGHVHVYVCV